MVYKVTLTLQAEEQMWKIIRYISDELKAPESAMRLLRRIRDKILSLEHLPQRIPIEKDIIWHN